MNARYRKKNEQTICGLRYFFGTYIYTKIPAYSSSGEIIFLHFQEKIHVAACLKFNLVYGIHSTFHH